jgi:hypothetical protein
MYALWQHIPVGTIVAGHEPWTFAFLSCPLWGTYKYVLQIHCFCSLILLYYNVIGRGRVKTINGHNPAFSQMETSENEAGFIIEGERK